MAAARLSTPRLFLVMVSGFLLALPVPFLFAHLAYEWGSVVLRVFSMFSVLLLPVVGFRLTSWADRRGWLRPSR